MVTILGAFGIVSMLSGLDNDAASMEEYRGLFRRKPLTAFIFTIMLLSLAGIPLTAGFLGKFYILMAGVQADLWWLVIILIVSSTIGLFYYLRIVVAMLNTKETDSPGLYVSPVSISGMATSGVLVILLIWMGTFPSALINLINFCCKSL